MIIYPIIYYNYNNMVTKTYIVSLQIRIEGMLVIKSNLGDIVDNGKGKAIFLTCFGGLYK